MGYDLAMTSGLQITVSSIHRQKHLGICLPTVRSQHLGPFRLRIFSAQVGNRTRAHGNKSNPLEISMSTAMKGESGLATGLTTLGALHPFIRAWKSGHRNLCQARIEPRGQGPIPFLLLYRGSSPFTHCASSAGGTLRHQYRYAPPVPVLRHQCRFIFHFVIFYDV